LGPQLDHRAADGVQPCPSRFEVCVDGRCPIEDTLNVIAGRWKILVLWWLQTGELRFGELRRHMPSVTPKAGGSVPAVAKYHDYFTVDVASVVHFLANVATVTINSRASTGFARCI
jgi:hypothetical protein